MVSCQKGPTRHAYAWQIGPFWQDTLELQVVIGNFVLNRECSVTFVTLMKSSTLSKQTQAAECFITK